MEIIQYHFESLGSTNDWAKEHLAELKEGQLLVIVADEQTRARGQYGRRWVAPKGMNLYVSFAFLAESPDGFALTRKMCLALQNVLLQEDIQALIKSPNDLLVEGRKIAGILCETAKHGVIIGVGLNVNMPRELIEAIDQPATSMLLAKGRIYERGDLLKKLIDVFLENEDKKNPLRL